jgi:mannose-6-phosphate isomerase-like protein (cupin superfamily)
MTIRSNRMRAWLVMLGVVAAMGGPAPAHAKDPDDMIILSPQMLRYIAIPDMPACATAAILRGNPRFGPAWVMLRLASGCQVPWHWHTANETLLVVSGRGSVVARDGTPLQFTPGAFAYLPAHHQHRAMCTRTCLLFNTADAAFDIHYVGANGEEVSLEEALRLSAPPARRPRARGRR